MKEAEGLWSRADCLRQERAGTFDNLFQRCVNWVLPEGASFTEKRHDGELMRRFIADNTAPSSLSQFANTLFTDMVNPGARWFDLKTGQPAIDEIPAVRNYFYDVRDIMLDAFASPESQFYSRIKEVFDQVALLGNVGMSVQPGDNSLLLFRKHTIDTYWIDVDNYGRVNSIFRVYEWSAVQAKEHSEEVGFKLPEHIEKYLAEGVKDKGKKFEFMQAVYPNKDYIPWGTPINTNLEYCSVWTERETKTYLLKTGFDRLPINTFRWEVYGLEKYGRSLTMRALPTIQQANEVAYTLAYTAELAARPPFAYGEEDLATQLDVSPNGQTVLTSAAAYGQGRGIQRVDTGANDGLPYTFEYLDALQQSIRRTFLEDVFLLPDDPKRTATEVAAIEASQRRQLVPNAVRMQSEGLGEVITSAYLLLNDMPDVLPPIPDEIKGQELRVSYRSALNRTQESTEAQATISTFEVVQGMAEMYPQSRFSFDPDKAIEVIGRGFGAPPGVIRELEDARKLQQEEQQQMQQQQQAEQAAMAVDAASKAASSGLINTGQNANS